MMLPRGLREARTHRPLLADYILGLAPTFWGLHVLCFPQRDLTDIRAYSWIHVPPWGVASAVLALGLCQFVAAIFGCPWGRRCAALLLAAVFFEFTVKIFVSEPSAPGSSMDLAAAVGETVLFFWPTL